MTRIIAVISGKGGVGKTTICTNLGAVLSTYFKKNVIVVDANITTSHLSLSLGMYYHPISLNHVLKGKVKIEDALYEHFSGMKVLPASLSVEDLKGVDILKLRKKLQEVFGKSDFVFLDSAPGLGREAIASLEACNEVLFVGTPHVPSVTDIIRTKKIADELGVKIIGTIMNMVTGEYFELKKEEVEALTETEVIGIIPFDKKVLKSLAVKVPVALLYPNAKVSREIKKIAMRILGLPVKEETIFDKFRYMFSKIFTRKGFKEIPSTQTKEKTLETKNF